MKSIRQSDLVADWIKTALDHTEVDKKSIREEDTVTVPDPSSPDNELRALTAYLYVNEASDDATRDTDYVVGAYWKDVSDQSDLFSEKYSSEQDAQMAYGKLKEQLHDIYRTLTVSKSKAEEMATDFFKEIAPSSAGPSIDPKNLSKLHQELLAGWQIVNQDGKLSVSFDDKFLEAAFRKFKATDELPASAPEVVYSTASKEHCGADNFIVSFWGKTETTEGNILRNVVRVERFGSDKTHTLVGATYNDLDTICSNLTPHQMEYGIGFDSITQQWHKTAKAVLQNIFFDTTEELMKYQREQKGVKTEVLPLLEEEEKKPEDLPELEEEPESISFDELMEKTTPAEQVEKKPEVSGPIPGGGPAPGMLASKKSPIKKEAALDVKTLKPGQNVVYVSEDIGQPIEGEVQSVKVNEAGQAEVVLKTPKGKEHTAVAEGDVSYFLDLGEYRDLKRQQIEVQKLEHEKEREYGPEFGPVHEPRAPQTKEEEEEEKEKEEGRVAPADLGEEVTEEYIDQLLSIKEFNLLKVAALKQWIDWPKGLPRPWMQQLYQKLTTNVRNELRETVHELDAKRQQNVRYYNRIMSLRTTINELSSKLAEEEKEFEKTTDPATKNIIAERLKIVKQQKHNRERDLEKARNRFRKEVIQPDSFKQAVMQMFMSYAPMAAEFDPRLMKEEDPQAVSTTSKKVREVLKKLKQVNTQIHQEESNLEGMVEKLNQKEEELWSHFKAAPEHGSPELLALSEKILQTDQAFSDYLTQAGSNMDEKTINEFQDAIESLEKQRMGVLPREEQLEVDDLIKEIHSIEDQIKGSETLKKIKQLEDTRDKLEDEKASLGEEIGLVAFLKEYKESGLIKPVEIHTVREFEIKVTREDEEGQEQELRITYTATPGSPAITTGPPERWTPADPGDLEIVKVEELKEDGTEVPIEDDGKFYDALIEEFDDQMFEHARKVVKDEEAYYAEKQWEEQREY